MDIVRDTYIGGITAITFSPGEDYIVYGSGKSVWIYDSESYKQITTFPALPNASIHGIRFNDECMCVFGQKEFAIYNWKQLKESQFQIINPIYMYDHFVDWIWDVCFMGPTSNDITQIAIGTAHNTVVLWNTKCNEPIQCFYGKERCILYSISILNLHGELLVASGTVFTEVHIWNVHHPESTHICKRHNGVIFKVRWSQDGRYLLSVSDDRSLILWKHSSFSEPWWEILDTKMDDFLQGEYTVAHRYYGHTARLWDCLFTPSCLVTSSEDCTVRFWNAEGECIAAFGGHKGKHIWCLAYDSRKNIILTGGNDNSIKMWSISDIIHSYQNASTQSYTIPTMVNANPNEPRNSKSECIRELAFANNGDSLFVASNWGYLWRFDIHEEKWNSIYSPDSHRSVSAMAVDPQNTVVVTGDCRGVIQIISLTNQFSLQEFQSSSVRVSKLILAEENDDSLWLFVLAADSTIFVNELDRHTGKCTSRSQVRCISKGVAIQLLWIQDHHCLCVSDSLGTVHLCVLEEKEDELICSQVASIRCHGLNPICCLTWKDDALWTGGNDGKIVSLSISWDSLTIKSNTPLAVPKIKQILSLWWSQENELCCAGYHEDEYLVYDTTNMVEVLSTPAGGWKRPSSSFSHGYHPLCGYVYAYASMNGFSDVCVFKKGFKGDDQYLPSLNSPSHGREINCVHWIDSNPDGGLIATGGEDRKVQIVEVQKKGAGFLWKILHVFEVHSSCVRSITSCKLANNRGYLLLSCGGRNTVCVWLIDPNTHHCTLQSVYPYRNSMNCSDEGDQRIMDVSILSGLSTLFFVTGDSCGKIHFYHFRENSFEPVLLFTSEIHTTPILSVQLVQSRERVMIIAGVASGDLIVIDITNAIAQFESTGEFIVEPSSFTLFPAIHVMGINDLKVIIEGDEVNCMTVGDDQSLRVTSLQYNGKWECVRRVDCELIAGTSLRGVTVVGHDIYTTGWEQVLQKWKWENKQLKKVSEMNLQVPETGCVDCIQNDGSVLGCVCGDMGFEIFELV